MTAPIQLAAWYATDEDVVMLADGDFEAVIPNDMIAAEGTDGAVEPGSWELTSAAVDFQAQQVGSNMVVQLLEDDAGIIGGSGFNLAIDSAAGHTLTLRRPGKALGWGQPPILAGATGIKFRIGTLANVMESVAYNLHQRFGMDPLVINRTPADVYDLRVFREVTVYETLRQRYATLNRAKAGDFWDKIRFYDDAVMRLISSITVRWGPNGTSQVPSGGRTSVRIGR